MAKTKRAYQRQRPNVKVASAKRQTLTPVEAAEITGIGITRTREMLKARRMPGILVGRRFYVPKAALMRWLETCGGGGKSAA
jgi:excisionase family DNA binding protein